MPPSLSATQRRLAGDIAKLDTVYRGIKQDIASPAVRDIVAEMILIRAALLLETALGEIAYKIAAGAKYIDGTDPVIGVQCRSVADARDQMLTTSGQRFLKWTSAGEIKKSVSGVVDISDHFLTTCDHFASNIREINKVRNFAAHRSSSARQKYNEVVRHVFRTSRSKPLGQFLLTTNYVPQPNLERYLVEVEIIVNALVKK